MNYSFGFRAISSMGIDILELVVCGHLLGIQVDLELVFVIIVAEICLFQIGINPSRGRKLGVVENGDGGRRVLQGAEERHRGIKEKEIVVATRGKNVVVAISGEICAAIYI